MMNGKDEVLLRRAGSSEPKLIYSYSPRKFVTVAVVLIIAMGAAGILLLHRVGSVSAVFALFVLVLIYQLLKTCSIRIWAYWPYLLYRYRSLFRKIDIVIPPWDVTGFCPDIVSMWRGHITERYLMEVGKMKLVVTPLYSRSDLRIATFMEEFSNLPTSREEAEYEIDLERRIQAEKEGVVCQPEKEMVTVWGLLEMSLQCPRCETPVVVNGPYTVLTCLDCGESIDLSPDIWTDLLEDVRTEIVEDLSEGEAGRSTIWGTYNTSLFYGRQVPYCMKCKRDFQMESDYGGGASLKCPACGQETSVIEAPDWFDSVFEGARLIVGASDCTGESNTEAQPVALSCAKCGAMLEVNGDARTVRCGHCDTSLYLPDDLWHVFHPVDIKRRWFVGFQVDPFSIPDTE